jgi:Pro-Pro endopeptidase
MPPALPTRIAALERDVMSFHGRLRDVADGSATQPLAPGAAAVTRAYADAAGLRQRAMSLDAARGWHELDRSELRAARRTVTSAANAARTAAQLLGTGPVRRAEVTASRTDPRSERSASTWLDATRGRDLPNVRVVGSIPPPAARLVARRFASVPERVVQQLDAQGLRSTLFSGRLTDVHGFRSLRGVQPRGWPAGSTWDQVPGVGTSAGMAANPSRDRRGFGHGTESLSLHELGHVVDIAMARPDELRISSGDRWRRGPWREARASEALGDYVTRHAEEWYAEAFVRYVRSPQTHASLARWYPDTFRFLSRELGPPRFGGASG